MRRYQLLIAGSVIVLDRLTKWLVVRHIREAHDIPVIPGLFQLAHWENTGAAFSLFADLASPWRTAGLISFSVIAVIVISLFLWKSGTTMTITTWALSLILGGACGNLWDRVAKGTVTDFLDFYIGQHHWPPFNVADSAIVVGAILLIWTIIFGPRTHAAKA